MLKKIIIITILFFSIPCFASFTPLNNTKIVHGSSATLNTLVQAGNANANRFRIAGAVSNSGKFAIATLKPSSVLGLGKQLAKGNPYTLVAMAGLAYFQDDIGQWYSEAEKTGEVPFLTPKSELKYNYKCTISAWGSHITKEGMTETNSQQFIKSTCLDPAKAKFTELALANGYVSADFISSTDTSVKFRTTNSADIENTQSANYGGSIGIQELSYSCPPFDDPSYILAFDSDGDGKIDKCFSPAVNEQYKDQPVTTEDMAEPYADDLMEWHNTSISDMKGWDPYIDSNGNVEPEYIDSYNQPAVSPSMNEYMKSVASGTYQTTDANAPNYVPSEMVQPTQSAINSTFNNDPFIDPTTAEVVTPSTSTDGAATPDPSPTGDADNPLHVTGNFTVDVQIPEDDTISQTEYEQSNEKFFNDFDTQAQLESTKLDTKIDDLKTADQDFIDSLMPDITGFDVPDFPTLSTIWPSFQTGTCIPLILNASVANLQQTITFDAHCPPYNTYIHPLLVWLLYLATGLYIFHLAHETLGRK